MDNDRVMLVFNWYKRARKSVGRKTSFPKTKDVTRTYLWRQLEAFLRKMDDMDADDILIQKMIDIIVKYAKNNGMLSRGASILAKQDLLDICYKKLEQELREFEHFITDTCHAANHIADMEDPLKRKSKNGYATMTVDFMTGRMNAAALSLSRKCCRALSSFDEIERDIYPSDLDLLKIRQKCLLNSRLISDVRDVLGSDLVRR